MKFVTVTVTLGLFEQAPSMGASETVSTLSDLLNSGPVSARQAADKATELGIKLPYGTIAAYWAGRHGKPSANTLAKLAQVVPFTEQQLQKAAWGTSTSLGPYKPPQESALLDHRQRLAVDELIRSIVAKQGASHADQSPTPADPPATPPRTQGEADQEQKTFTACVVDTADPGTLRMHQIQGVDLADALKQAQTSLELAGFTIEPQRGDVHVTARRDSSTLMVQVEEGGEAFSPNEIHDALRTQTPSAGSKPTPLTPEGQGRGLDRQSDYNLVARTGRGPSERELFDAAQDAAAEAPDPEGPEGGA